MLGEALRQDSFTGCSPAVVVGDWGAAKTFDWADNSDNSCCNAAGSVTGEVFCVKQSNPDKGRMLRNVAVAKQDFTKSKSVQGLNTF